MVRVYFKNGHSAAASHATTAETTTIFEVSAAGTGVAGLVCKDKEGKVVAQFRLDDIIGYEID